MTDFGKDAGRREPQPEKTPQQKLEKIWGERMHWHEGPDVKLTESLPEGMRLVMVDPEFLVLRSPLPGVPIDSQTGKPKDVPIAIFGPNVEPKYVEEEAKELGKKIQEGEVWYVPPEEIIMK